MRHKRTTELRFPGLWRGCVGAWAPCLGPTGLTLRDWSGYAQHGTLTNMSAGSDWVLTTGRYALDLDGVDDFLAFTPSYAAQSQDFTVVVDLFLRPQSKALVALVDFDHASAPLQGWVIQSEAANTTGRYYLAYYTGTGFAPATGAAQGIAIPTNVRSTIAYVKRGTSMVGYLNGVADWLPGAASSAVVSWVAGRPMRIGTAVATSRTCDCIILGAALYNRPLSVNEVQLLTRSPDIAYRLAPRRRSSAQVAAAFNRRRRVLIGAGS